MSPMIRPFDERLPDTRTSPRRLPDVENGGGAFLVVTPSAFHLRPCPIARNVAAPATWGGSAAAGDRLGAVRSWECGPNLS